MQQVTIKLTGTGTLMMCNPRTANPLDEYSKAIKELTSKRKRTDKEEEDLRRLKWEAALYYDKELGPYVPTEMFWRSLQDAARLSREGKSIERGVTIAGDKVRLDYDGPRKINDMFAAGKYVDVRQAKPRSGGLVIVARPIFPPPWHATFDVVYDPDQINQANLLAHADKAGKLIGIGTYRRSFGRYSVEPVNGKA